MYQRFEIMFIFSSINLEPYLASLISNTVPYLTSKHHLITSHKVKHHCFKRRLHRFHINQIKVNLFVGRYLNPNVSFDVKDQTFVIECFVKFPFVKSLFIVKFSFEKEYFCGTSGYESSSIDKEHLSQVMVCYLLELNGLFGFWIF